MKLFTINKTLGIFLMSAIVMFAPFATATNADGPVRVDFGDMLAQLRDGNCNTSNPSAGIITSATPLDTPIYNAIGCGPILAPDGHHVTLGEWKAAEGTATVKCINRGTHSVLHFSGLIPKGVYTVWLFVFANGGPPTPPTAVGALGNSDPSDDTFENSFTASESGEGQLSLIQQEGVLSANNGPIAACWLDTYPAVRLTLAYHIDGQTSGPVPGPTNTWVPQQVYIFR